mgnify:CR=1 FL=1
MKWFINLRTRSKLFLSFIVLLIFMGIIGAAG